MARPVAQPYTKERLLARLEGTDVPDGCWVWTGSNSGKGGYGTLTSAGQSWKAHRMAYTLFNGPIPEGHDVCHSCDNPPCCNPAHLFAGMPRDNLLDMFGKGRREMPNGSAHSRAKMTEEVVLRIRELHALGELTNVEIAAQFGVNPQRVSSVVHRKTWKHV